MTKNLPPRAEKKQPPAELSSEPLTEVSSEPITELPSEPPSELSSWLDAYVRDLELRFQKSPRTVEAYRDVVKRYLDHAATLAARPELGSIRSFLREASANLAKSSQAQWSSALRNFIVWARSERLALPVGLEREISRPRVPKKLVQVFDEDDLDRLVAAVGERQAAERLLFALLYGSGLRISEAAGLEWGDFDTAQSLLRVRGKGRKWRQVPLAPGAVAVANELRGAARSAENIWAGEAEGAGANRAWVGRLRSWVNRWGELAGFEAAGIHLYPHKLRHSLATHLLRRGARLPQLQKLLGHQRLGTTERYTHLDPQDLVKIYDKAFPKPRKIR